jgi:hypothetical protein
MELRERLSKKQDAIVERWVADVLATYPDEAAAAFSREKDPFANPVGNSLRVGTRGIFEALLEGTDAGEIQDHLHEIIRIRAVQDFTASESVGFVLGLKKAIRAELGAEATDARFTSDMADVNDQIDRFALAAFDVFAQCREQVYDLRVSEMKRRVSWIMGKLNERELDSDLAQIDLGEEV